MIAGWRPAAVPRMSDAADAVMLDRCGRLLIRAGDLEEWVPTARLVRWGDV
jgi:hypothetical protein